MSLAPSPETAVQPADTTATKQVPDASGRFGDFGGRYVPETLTRALDELVVEYQKALQDPDFHAELNELLHRMGAEVKRNKGKG